MALRCQQIIINYVSNVKSQKGCVHGRGQEHRNDVTLWRVYHDGPGDAKDTLIGTIKYNGNSGAGKLISLVSDLGKPKTRSTVHITDSGKLSTSG